MRKSFIGSALGTLFGGLLLLAGLALAGPLPQPSINGPSLGDPVSNLYSVITSYTMGRGLQVSPALSVDQSSGQSNCTQLSQTAAYAVANIGTSSGTGYVCLPTAYSGHWQIIANATGQTIDIYSSAASYVAGTADTINTSAGTSAYTGLTTHKTAICFAYANGAWACGSIS